MSCSIDVKKVWFHLFLVLRIPGSFPHCPSCRQSSPAWRLVTSPALGEPTRRVPSLVSSKHRRRRPPSSLHARCACAGIPHLVLWTECGLDARPPSGFATAREPSGARPTSLRPSPWQAAAAAGLGAASVGLPERSRPTCFPCPSCVCPITRSLAPEPRWLLDRVADLPLPESSILRAAQAGLLCPRVSAQPIVRVLCQPRISVV
jgi:hypothetical protein